MNKNVENKKKNPILIIFLIILILIVIILFGARIYFRLPVKDYYACSEKAFIIPDINKNFIPQGITYNESDKCFLITGYMKDESASPIYVIDENGTLLAKALMTDKSGNPLNCHSGGISIYKDYVYIAGCQTCTLHVFSYDEIKSCNNSDDLKNGKYVSETGEFSTYINDNDYLNIDFTTIIDNKIILGEFYREDNFDTLDTHKIITGCGDNNHALAVAFELGNYDDTFGINPSPCYAYSITDMVQGMAENNGVLYTSSSYAVSDSTIRAYDYNNAVCNGTINILGCNVNLYELDSSIQTADYLFPPMAEEIQFVDDMMYTMCESASNKYIFGKLTSHQYCYVTDLSLFDVNEQ